MILRKASTFVIFFVVAFTLTLAIADPANLGIQHEITALRSAYSQLPTKSIKETRCLHILEYACRGVSSIEPTIKNYDRELPEAAVGRLIVAIVQGGKADLDTAGIPVDRLQEIAVVLCRHGRFEEAIRLAKRPDLSAEDSINIQLVTSLFQTNHVGTNGINNASVEARLILETAGSNSLPADAAGTLAWSAMLCSAANNDGINCRWFAQWLHLHADPTEMLYLDYEKPIGLSKTAVVQLASIARELPSSPLRGTICRYLIRTDNKCWLGHIAERLAWLEPSDSMEAELLCWKVRSDSGIDEEGIKNIGTNNSIRRQVLFRFSKYELDREVIEKQHQIVNQLEKICATEDTDHKSRQVHWSLLARIAAKVDRRKATSILDREFDGLNIDPAVDPMKYENDALPNLFAANAILDRSTTCSALLTIWGQQRPDSDLTSSQFIDADLLATCIAHPGLLNENTVKNRIVLADPFTIGMTGPKDINAMLLQYPEKQDQFWVRAGVLTGELLRRNCIDDSVIWELIQ